MKRKKTAIALLLILLVLSLGSCTNAAPDNLPATPEGARVEESGFVVDETIPEELRLTETMWNIIHTDFTGTSIQEFIEFFGLDNVHTKESADGNAPTDFYKAYEHYVLAECRLYGPNRDGNMTLDPNEETLCTSDMTGCPVNGAWCAPDGYKILAIEHTGENENGEVTAIALLVNYRPMSKELCKLWGKATSLLITEVQQLTFSDMPAYIFNKTE